MTNLFNLLSVDMIEDYIRSYALSDEGEYYYKDIDLKHILRFWNAEKQDLFKMFNENLIISKHISVTKPRKVLNDEISDLVGNHIFISKSWDREPIWDYLIDNEGLVENKYNGPDYSTTINNNDIKIRTGEKLMKVLGKFAKAWDIEPEFENFRRAHSMILNQKTLDGELCLSIHPLDYITMSDNNNDWDSCMSWMNYGGYREGTVEMMNSPCVIVAYLKSNSKTLDNGWNSKKWRELFIVDDNIIMGIKGYPFDSEALEDICYDWLLDLTKERDNWFFATKEKNDDVFNNHIRVIIETNKMYNDTYYSTRAYLNKNIEEYYFINYSGETECMICGDTFDLRDEEAFLACPKCQGAETCASCGNYLMEDEDYIITQDTDKYYCYDCGIDHLYRCEYSGLYYEKFESVVEIHIFNTLIFFYISKDYIDEVRNESCGLMYDNKENLYYMDKNNLQFLKKYYII